MADNDPSAATVDPLTARAHDTRSAASDLRDAFAWTGFGIAVLWASLAMDRLERQNINPYTVPGLLPGLLGIAMIVIGGLLGIRSWRRRLAVGERRDAGEAVSMRRPFLIIALVVAFAVGLVGHGLPFWLAAAVYVVVSILVLQTPQRRAQGRGLSVRDVAGAAAIGLAAGAIITLVFQELFLVRLP